MSRKITEQAVRAFLAHEDFRSGNTEIYQTIQGPIMALHGNDIARIEEDYENEKTTIYVTNAGWFSNTTKERLNGIPGVCVYQKKGKWYLNDKEWDGTWQAI